jgi:hypothetical protein
VNEGKVVLFDRPSRGGMARRGAPDKSAPSCEDVVVLRCPSCGSDLRLEADWMEEQTGVLCGRCETEIPLPSFRRETGVR